MIKHLLLIIIAFTFAFSNAQTVAYTPNIPGIQNELNPVIVDTINTKPEKGNYTITTVEEYPSSGIKVEALPNHSKNYVWLNVRSPKHENLEYTVKGKTGKTIETGKIHTSEIVCMENYGTGTYFITVTRNKSLIKSFQVIKN
jgi:PDZ domain-containing secreted protein